MAGSLPTVLLAAALAWAALASASADEEVVYAAAGSTATLARTGFTDKDQPLRIYMYWTRQDHDLAWHNPLSGWKYTAEERWKDRLSVSASADVALVIKDVKQEDFGTFALFKLVSNVRVAVKTYQLAKINVSLSPASLLLPGESAHLFCDVAPPPGRAKPPIYWRTPGGERMNGGGGKLSLTTTRQHHGAWTCVVANRRRQDTASVSVPVLDLLPAPSYPVYTSKSSPLALPCSLPPYASWEQIKAKGVRAASWRFLPAAAAAAADPQTLFSLSLEEAAPAWRPDAARGLQTSDNLQRGDLSLSRRAGREEDAGHYLCAVTFEGGAALEVTARVDVLQITASPATHVVVGQSFNLSCGLGPGRDLTPGLRLRWFAPKDSSLPPASADPRPAPLAVPEARWEDGGKWRCELWRNNTRLTSAELTLHIDPKLSVWMLVTICGAAVIAVLALVLAFILCRRRQRRPRHLKHRLCHCKNPKPKGFYRT